VPELVILTVCEFFWPTTTELKSMTAGTTEILAGTRALSAETDAQPEETTARKMATAKSM
jgi:hypothetical protein